VQPPIIATLSCSRIAPDRFNETLNRLIDLFIAAGLLKRNVQGDPLLAIQSEKINVAFKIKSSFTKFLHDSDYNYFLHYTG